MNDLSAEVVRIIAAVIDVPPTEVPACSLGDHPQWDSLAQVELIFRLEERFGVEFSDEDLVGMRNVASVIEALQRCLSSI